MRIYVWVADVGASHLDTQMSPLFDHIHRYHDCGTGVSNPWFNSLITLKYAPQSSILQRKWTSQSVKLNVDRNDFTHSKPVGAVAHIAITSLLRLDPPGA
jgi:hypothetical protein